METFFLHLRPPESTQPPDSSEQFGATAIDNEVWFSDDLTILLLFIAIWSEISQSNLYGVLFSFFFAPLERPNSGIRAEG